jgi:hypothetical protein
MLAHDKPADKGLEAPGLRLDDGNLRVNSMSIWNLSVCHIRVNVRDRQSC